MNYIFFKKFLISFIASIFMCATVLGNVRNKEGYEKLRAELVKINGTDKLTEWDFLILAICGVESRYTVTTNENYHGFMQIGRVYVKEVNRLAGTEYTYADARDFRKSVEMHNLMNEHKNPSRSIKKALKIHNGSNVYRSKVLKELSCIFEYEKKRNSKT